MFNCQFLLNIAYTTLLLFPQTLLLTSQRVLSNIHLSNNTDDKYLYSQLIAPETKPTLAVKNQTQQKEKLIALVIGNSEYDVRPIDNPVNDASDIAAILEELGFDVIRVLDADLKEMNRAIERFHEKLEAGAIGLFYYAGHGMQVDGENYLLPTDAKLKDKNKIENETIALGEVLKKMESVNTKMNIIILDACRNDPFRSAWRGEENPNFGVGGLAPVDAKAGSFIAYSTAPGEYSADGYGRNSPYTEQLKKYIKTPDLDIEIMFRKVRSGVYEETKGYQIPWVSVSITDGFSFNSTENNNTASITTLSSEEEELSVIMAATAVSTYNMYQRLEYFLNIQKWQKADQQTWEIIRQVGNYGRTISLTLEEIDKFSCTDLQKIDGLWLNYSNNRFGLSIQEEIYKNSNANSETNSLQALAKQVGWRTYNNQSNQEEYIAYNDLNFSLNAPLGHFPTTVGIDALSSVARQWSLYTAEYETFLAHLLDRVAICKQEK